MRKILEIFFIILAIIFFADSFNLISIPLLDVPYFFDNDHNVRKELLYKSDEAIKIFDK